MPLPKYHVIAQAACLFAVLAGPATAPAQAKANGLSPAIQAQMDAAAAKFTTAQADLKQELFTKVVHDTETQNGQIYVQRSGSSAEMGIRIMPPDAKPGAAPARIVVFKNNKAQSFEPGTNQINTLSATGKNQATAETIMSLGFGGSGSDLAKAWTITDQGSEQMSDGSKTVSVEKLDLVPKDSGIRDNYATHITIWVDPARDVSLKQVSFQASGDTRTVYYTNIRLNQRVDSGPFAINCKGKCTVVPH